jgi:uncharacterized membrane protein
MATSILSIILILFAAVINALGPIYIKKSTAKGFSFKPKKMLKNKNLIKGTSFYLLSAVLFIPALKWGEISVLYPIGATTYIWVCLFSTRMLKEKMNLLKWAGIALILLGISFISIGISG